MTLYSPFVFANPQGGTVSGGSASISENGKNLDINQSTDKAVIDWRRFDIAPDEATEFHQPNANSITLNRVNTGGASTIDGRLTANGNILILNQNGVVFGSNAKVDVNGLVATTANISNQDFMAGKLKLDQPGNPDAAVINNGTITAKEAGLVGLVAPRVENNGVITAKLGRVHLASGDMVTVDFYGDGLMEVAVSDQVKSQIVSNTGTIEAGRIAMTAAAGKSIVNSLINVKGTLNATRIAQKGGDILIYAEGSNAVKNNTASLKGKKTGTSKVVVQATLNASGKGAGQKGGTIQVLGDNVTIKSGSVLNASGPAGGGTINIGGSYQGKGTVPSSLLTVIEKDAMIEANALDNGVGGNIYLWSDGTNNFAGHAEARGGLTGGDGGFIEVSGKHQLGFDGTVDLRAPHGATGTLLLDPENVTISTGADQTDNNCAGGNCTATGDNSVVNVTTLQNALANSNVTISTGSSGSQAGNITVANSFTWGTGNLLTLLAAGNITINSGVTISNTYTGSTFGAGAIPVVLALRADSAGINGSATAAGSSYGVVNNGTINMSGSAGAVSIFYDWNGTYTAGTQTANGSWAAPANLSVNTQFTAYRLVNSAADLAAIGTNGTTLGNTYALGTSLNGGGATFNSDTPIGNGSAFTGIFDGQWCQLTGGAACSITNYSINTTQVNAGLFSSNGGRMRNLAIGINVTAVDSAASGTVGMLTGGSGGSSTIANVTGLSSGSVTFYSTVSGSTVQTVSIGGLTGGVTTSAVMVNSSAAIPVNYIYQGTSSATSAVYIGGLVGLINSTATVAVSGSSASGDVSASYSANGCSGAACTGNVSGLVGGLAGSLGGNTATSTSNNFATGKASSSLIGGNEYVGGLGGQGYSSLTTSVLNSYATGDVSYTGAWGAIVGGLIGNNVSGTVAGTGSTYTYATGKVNYTGSVGTAIVGGFAGYNSGTINQAYAQTGTVTINSTVAGSTASNQMAGGLVGQNAGTGTISNSTASGNVTYIYQGTSSGTTSAFVGGLVGYNPSTAATSVSNSSASGTVTAQYSSNGCGGAACTGNVNGYVGGLMGQNGSSTATATATTGNSATGSVTSSLIGGSEYVGGLMGWINSTSTSAVMNSSYTAGTVSYTGAGSVNLGGFMGYLQAGTVGGTGSNWSFSSASINITNGSGGNFGGFAGVNNGTINQAYATGSTAYSSTTNGALVGGLVGSNTGTVKNAYSSGGTVSVTAPGTFYVGGLVGYNTGTVGDSAATSATTWSSDTVQGTNNNATTSAVYEYIGGLVGLSTGTGVVTNAMASGAVSYTLHSTTSTGSDYVGGFIGADQSTAATSISNSYATGAVTANSDVGTGAQVSSNVGGFAGLIYITSGSTIVNGVFSTGAVSQSVSVSSAGIATGGLVGAITQQTSSITLSNSYSTGSVSSTGTSGGRSTGGLAGSSSGTISNSYATGYTTASGGSVGGLVGSSTGTVTGSYWDTLTTGQASSAAGTGATTTALQAALQSGWSTSTWGIVAGSSYPYLKWQVPSGTPQVISGLAYSDIGSTLAKGAGVGVLVNGSSTGSLLGATETTGNNGYYYFLLAPSTISGSGSQVLTYLTGATKGNTFQDNATGSLSGLSLYGTELRMLSAGTTFSGMTTDLATALGGNSGSNFLFSLSSGNITMAANAILGMVMTGSTLSLDKMITASGTGAVIISDAGTVTQSAAMTTPNLVVFGGGNFTLANTGNSIGTVAASTSGFSLTDSANLTVGSLYGTTGITTGTGNLTLTADGMNITAALTGTGTLTLAGANNSTSIGLGDGSSGTLNFTEAELNRITDGWSQINIGVFSSTGAMDIRAHNWLDPITFTTAGVISVNGAQTFNNNAVIFRTDSNPVIAATLTGSNDIVFKGLNNGTTIGLGDGQAGTLNLTNAELDNIQDGFRTITFGVNTMTGAMNVGAYSWKDTINFNTASGVISFNGAQNFNANAAFIITDANPVLNAALAGTGALTIKGSTNSTTFGIGDGSSGTLNLTETELNQIADGFSSITFGTTTTTGAMDIRAHTWLDPVTFTTNTGVISVNGAQNFGANDVTFSTNANPAFNAAMTGTGKFNVQVVTSGTTIGLGDGSTGTVNLSNADLDNITDGYSQILIGNSVTGAMDVRAYTWKDSLLLRSGTGAITINGAQNFAANPFTVTTDSGLVINAALTGTGNMVIRTSGTASMGLGAGASGTVLISDASLNNISSGWGSITFGVTNATGAMDVRARTWNAPVTFLSGTGVISFNGTQNFGANAATITTNADVAINAALTGTGTLIIQPNAATTTMGLGDGASGTINLATAELNNITDGWSSIVFGNTNVTANMDVRAATWKDNITFASNTGVISFNGAQSFGANNATIQTDANVSVAANLAGSGTLTFQQGKGGSTSFGIGDGSSGTVNFTNAELDRIADGWGSIVFGNATLNGAMDVRAYTWKDNVNFVTHVGGISFNGAQNVGSNNLTISSDHSFVLNGALTGTGILTIQGATPTTQLGIGDSSGGTLKLAEADLNQITDGWSSIVLGSTTMTGAMDVRAHTWSDPVSFVTNTGLITFHGAQDFGSNNATINSNVDSFISSSLTGTGSLTVLTTASMGFGSGNTVIFDNSELGRLSFGSYQFGSAAAGNIVLNMAAVLGAPATFISGGNITMSRALASSASGDAITLVAGGNFINNVGANAFTMNGTGRWLVYSTNPANDTVNSLSSDFRRYSCTYGGSCPAFASTGNGLLYTYTPILTVTPDQHVTYGDAATSVLGHYGVTYSGYLTGDAAQDVVTGSLAGTSSYAQGNNAGSYNINYASGTLASAMGYSFVYANSATGLTVDPKSLTVTADAKSKVYGATDPSYTYTYSGLVNGDLSAIFTGALLAPTDPNVGNHSIGQGTLAATGNYTIGTYVADNLTITPAPLDVTVNNASRVYGASNPGFTLSYAGLVNGDNSSVFSGYSFSTTSLASGVGSYGLNLVGGSAGNYTITRHNGILTITPAALTIAANNYTRTQGTDNPIFGVSYSGLVNGDTGSVVTGLGISSPAIKTSPVGSYAILLSGGSAANYVINLVNGQILVLPAEVLPSTVAAVSQMAPGLSAPMPTPAPVTLASLGAAPETPFFDALMDLAPRYHRASPERENKSE